MLFISNEANDDEYSAKTNAKPNNVDDYWRYYEMDYDDWLGKMRERTSALYKIVAGIGRMEMSDANAALHYAVMDLNKRGGGSDVKSSALHSSYSNFKPNSRCVKPRNVRILFICSPNTMLILSFLK
jgi:hypothetical protein